MGYLIKSLFLSSFIFLYTSYAKTSVGVLKSEFHGWYLVAGEGMEKPGFALYTSDLDNSQFSACEGDCTTTWMPAYVDDPENFELPENFPKEDFPGKFAVSGHCETGRLQLTYDGKPLYYYNSDIIVGHTNGVGHLVIANFPLVNFPIPNTCNDNTLSPGEESVDCGGDCAPCEAEIPKCSEFGIKYLKPNVGLIYHRDDGWTANFSELCIDGVCGAVHSSEGYFKKRAALADGQTYNLSFKVQDDQIGQYLSGEKQITFDKHDCYFQATCSDGLRNQDEEDVDCGGICGACPTCSDGIKNGNEEAIDCGGSCSQSCSNVCEGTAYPLAQLLKTDESLKGKNDGKITFVFDDIKDRNELEFSIDGGKTFPISVEDSEEAHAIGSLKPGKYDVWARWSNGDCPIPLEELEIQIGGAKETCADGILNQNETTVDCGGVCGKCETSQCGDIPLVHYPTPALPTPVVGSELKPYGYTFDLEGRDITVRVAAEIFKQTQQDQEWELHCSCNQVEFYKAEFDGNNKAQIPAECKDTYYYFLRYKRYGPVNSDEESRWVYSTLFIEDEKDLSKRVDPSKRPTTEHVSANWMRFRHPHAHDGITEAIFDAQHNSSLLKDLDRYVTTVTDGPNGVDIFVDLQDKAGAHILPMRIEALESGHKPNETPTNYYNNPTCCKDDFNYGNVISYEVTAVAGGIDAQTYNTYQHFIVGQGFNSALGDPRLTMAGRNSTHMVFADTGVHADTDKDAVFTQHIMTLTTENEVNDFLDGHHLFHGVDSARKGTIELGTKKIHRFACGDCHFRDGRSSEAFGTPKGLRVAPPTYGTGFLQYIEGAEARLTWDGSTSKVADQTHNALRVDHGVIPENLDQEELRKIIAYTEFLTVPNRRPRAIADPDVVEGEVLFHTVGCASCHQPTQKTSSDAPEIFRDAYLRPYSDMKLHTVNGGMFRTPPLWGLGRNIEILERNKKDIIWMHDGSAATLEEAIQLHNADAANVRDRFNKLNNADQEKIIKFLKTL